MPSGVDPATTGYKIISTESEEYAMCKRPHRNPTEVLPTDKQTQMGTRGFFTMPSSTPCETGASVTTSFSDGNRDDKRIHRIDIQDANKYKNDTVKNTSMKQNIHKASLKHKQLRRVRKGATVGGKEDTMPLEEPKRHIVRADKRVDLITTNRQQPTYTKL